MSNEEIIEGNFLISKAMGYTYPSANSEIFRLSYDLHNYHEDWNKLMPVVEKIEGLKVEGNQWTVLDDNTDVEWNFEVRINSKQCTINRCAYDGDEEDFLSLYDCRNYNKAKKIDATWLAVVEFYKWYNQNTQQ